MKILIVEDNEISNNLLTVILEAEGYDVLRAYNGCNAYKIIEKNTDIELVISDIQMPIIDGYTLLSMVRGNEKYKNIHFILYSAYFTYLNNKKMAYELGADLFIAKTGHNQVILDAANFFAKNGNGNSIRTI